MDRSEESGSSSKPSGDATWWVLCVIWVSVLALWAFFGWFSLTQQHVKDPGVFGDMFGAVNALFSGLAFGTLIYTIILQRRELSLQRMELAQTRAELAGQREQMELQNEVMRKDSFESSFFRVLAVLAEIVDAIDIAVGSAQKKGRDCFTDFYERTLARSFSVRKPENPYGTEKELVDDIYMSFYRKHQGDVGHYFRTLYNLVKLVDRSDVEDKHFYTNLIRAQLSNQETLLLFYNCACGLGQRQFKPLVERYALLKNMPKDRLLAQDHADWFEKGAYGGDK